MNTPNPAPPPQPPAPLQPAPVHTPLIERMIQVEQRLAKYEKFIVDVVRELGL